MAMLHLKKQLAPREEFDRYLELFNTRCRALNYSPRTINEFYRFEFKAFRRYLDDHALDLTPKEITTDLIRDFLAHRQQAQSNVTARHSWQVLSVWFKFLFSEGVVQADPMERIAKPKVRKIVMQTYSTEQVEAMLAGCDCKTFVGARDFAILMLLCDCGLRVTELVSLQMSDVSFAERVITIAQAKCNKMRTVPYGEVTARALNHYITKCVGIENRQHLFVSCYGQPLHRRHVLTIAKRRGEQAGILPSRCGVHMFRRFFANMAQSDVIAKHRSYSPVDRLKAPQQNSSRSMYGHAEHAILQKVHQMF